MTITGTVGWEAMLLQKPVLLMAETPYMLVGEGFVLYKNNGELHTSIEKAYNTPPASDEALIQYIAAVMAAGVVIPDDLLWRYSNDRFNKHIDVSNIVVDSLLKTSHYIKA